MEICYVNQIGDKLLINIFQMFTTVIQALPAGVLVAVIAFLIIKVFEKIKGIRIKRIKQRDVIILAAYLMILFDITIFSRKIGSVNVIDLIPFNTPGGIRYIILYALANGVMFIPFGYLISTYIKPKRILPILIVSALTSTTVEFVQSCIGRSFDVDDILLNVVGALIGFLLYVSFNAIKKFLPGIFQNELFYNILSIIVLILIVLYVLSRMGVNIV